MHQTSDKHIRQAVHCHNSFRKARKIKVVFLHDNPPNPFENGVKVQLLFCGKINRRMYAPERNVYVPAGGVNLPKFQIEGTRQYQIWGWTNRYM